MAEIEVSFFYVDTQPASHILVASLAQRVSNSHFGRMEDSSLQNSGRRPGMGFLGHYFTQIHPCSTPFFPKGYKNG